MLKNEEQTIKNIFPNAVNLQYYLTSCVDGGECIVLESDSAMYKKLLRTTMIVPDANTTENKLSIPTVRDRLSIKEALNSIIAKLVRQNQGGYRTQNCLALGYRQKSSSQAAAMRSNFDVECYFVNTVLPMVSSRVWEQLAGRIGEAILLHIFQRPLFLLSKNGCFLQVSGVSSSELVYQQNRDLKIFNVCSSSGSHKRLLVDEPTQSPKLRRVASASSVATVHNPKNNITASSLSTSEEGLSAGPALQAISASSSIPRYKLFYRSNQQLKAGLPTKHIFSKTLSGDAMVYSVFKSVLHQIKYSQQHDSIHQRLADLMRTTAKAFKACDIALLLHLHCPVKTSTDSPSSSHREANASAVAGSPISITLGQHEHLVRTESTGLIGKKKKTRRGCRAGKLVKHRGHSQSTGSRNGVLLPALLMTQTETPQQVEFNRHNTAAYYFDDYQYDSQDLTPEDLVGGLLSQPEACRDENFGATNEVVMPTQSTAVENADDEPVVECLITKTLTTESNCSRSRRKKLKRQQRKLHQVASPPFASPGRDPLPVQQTAEEEALTQTEKTLKAPLQLEEGVNLLTLHASHARVASFLKAVLIRALPYKEVWGTRRNQSVVLSCVTSYVALGRHETISLVHVTQGIRVTDIPWLRLDAASKDDSIVQQQLLLTFMHWLYCDFIHPLLCSSFYITEIDGHKFDCCYYRHPVWSLIVKKGMHQMRSNFSEFDAFTESKDSTNTVVNGGKILKRSSSTGSTSNIAVYESPTKKIRRIDSVGSDSGTTSAVGVDANVLDAVRRRNYLQRVPRVRFVPKKSSVRALTNLKSNFKSSYGGNNGVGAGEVLTNSALFNCLHVLKHVYQSNPLAGGFGTFGIDDIYLKFRKYVNTIREQQVRRYDAMEHQNHDAPASGSMTLSGLTGSPTPPMTKVEMPHFYMAVLDLEKCYDNINKEFLFDIVQKLLLKGKTTSGSGGILSRSHSSTTPALDTAEGAHLIHRYTVSHAVPSLDKTLTKTVRHVSSSEEIVSFQEASEEISRCYRNSIITDGVVYNRVTNQEVLKLLHTHLFAHTVKIPTDGSTANKRVGTRLHRSASVDRGTSYQCYRQVKGIPQGSILSPLLCNIYYGYVENDLFNNIFSIEILGLTDRSVIIRLIDDYIMISTDQSCVQHFLQMVHVNLKPFGGGVNPLKTKVNFDTSIEVGGKQIDLHNIHSHLMPFCGMFVNTSTLEITPNLGRFFERPIGSSIVVEYTRSGGALRKAIKSYIRTKCDAILLDRSLNQKSTVMSTLYSMYLLAAMRTHNFINKVRAFGSTVSPSCMYSCITEGLLFGARLVHVRTKRKKSKMLRISSSREEDDEENVLDGNDEHCDLSISYDNARSLFERCISTVAPSCFGSCELTLEESLWLGLRAFLSTLACRKSLYGDCIKKLKSKLDQIECSLKKRNLLPSYNLLYPCEYVLQSDSWL